MPTTKTLWSSDALDLIKKRYLVSQSLSIDEWIHKVCSHICQHYSSAEKEIAISTYADLLKSRRFLPTSAALHNSLKGKGSLAGCIVLPLPDNSMDILQKAIPEMSEVLFSGIGVGIDLSVIAPRLFHDRKTERASPGPSEMLKAITASTEAAMNYGGVKRSAFMAALHCQHPDIFEFIAMKSANRLANVNISVSIDQTFRLALNKRTFIPVLYKGNPVTPLDLENMKQQALARSLPEHDLSIVDGRVLVSKSAGKTVGKEINNQLYFDPESILEMIADYAHQCGDPGLINLEAINKHNPTHPRYSQTHRLGVGEIFVTTPCGEQPLLPYEVCHLGSLNLASFASDKSFDWNSFNETAHLAVRFMDDLIDAGDNVLEEANQMAQANRKIGIGLMGLADALAEMELPYDSLEARSFVQRIGLELHQSVEKASGQLADERGTFPAWNHSKFKKRRRHATLTTIAPTGHISTLADCSTSIEPYFLVSYGRDAAGYRRQTSSVLMAKLAAINFTLEEWIQKTIEINQDYRFDGTLKDLQTEVSEDFHFNQRLRELKGIFKTAHEIAPKDHLEIVKILQESIENGISKTINLANTASVHDVKAIYRQAIEDQLKGITVFRDGCLDEQALFAIEACPFCQATQFLTPSDCAGWKCDPVVGGCGWEVCAI